MALVTASDYQNLFYKFLHYFEDHSGVDVDRTLYDFIQRENANATDVRTLQSGYKTYKQGLAARIYGTHSQVAK